MKILIQSSLAAAVLAFILPAALPGPAGVSAAAQEDGRRVRIRERDDDRGPDGRRGRDDDRGRRDDDRGRDGRRDRDDGRGRRDHDRGDHGHDGHRGRGDRDGYWGNYWRWYDDDFRRYYHRRDRDRNRYGRDYGDRYGYDDDFSGSYDPYDRRSRAYNRGYRSPYRYSNPSTGWRDDYYGGNHHRHDDHSLSGPHNSLDIGPLHFDWR